MPERIRVLLDESIPEKLRLAFSASFDVRTVRYQGWSGLTNGNLLRAAEATFDILVTVDKGLRHQQNVGERAIAVVVFDAGGTTLMRAARPTRTSCLWSRRPNRRSSKRHQEP